MYKVKILVNQIIMRNMTEKPKYMNMGSRGWGDVSVAKKHLLLL